MLQTNWTRSMGSLSMKYLSTICCTFSSLGCYDSKFGVNLAKNPHRRHLANNTVLFGWILSCSNVWLVAVFVILLLPYVSFFPCLLFISAPSSFLLDELSGGLPELGEGGPGQVLHPLGQLELGRRGVEQAVRERSELSITLVLKEAMIIHCTMEQGGNEYNHLCNAS
jgi:hypothetical protein